MKKQPLVSVIMPVYNGSRFVEKAIESILNQAYPRLELIVIDDGSTDGTWQILRAFRKKLPKKIRIFRFKKNQGESAAANYAFAKSRGNYIARMDSDDIAQKDRIAKQVAYMETHPGVIVLGTQAKVIDKRGRIIGAKQVPLDHESIYRNYAWIHPMLHPSLMFRRSMLPKGKPLYRNAYEPNDDYYTLFDLLNYGKFANLPESLISYRVHGKNKSLAHIKQKFWNITKIRLTAITKLNYRAPVFIFPVLLVQSVIAIILPERLLAEIFFYMRGLKQLPTLRFALPTFTATIKRYAINLQ